MSTLSRLLRFLLPALAIAAMLAMIASPAVADPLRCHKQVVRQLARYKDFYLRRNRTCLEAQNLGKVAACPDLLTQTRIDSLNQKVVENIAKYCTIADIQTLGFRSDCAYEAATMGIEGQCAALPVTSGAEFAECMKCWKEAELAEFLAILFASHAVEICEGSLDETSPRCSDLDCATPLPNQGDLGDSGENDCQKAIGRAGTRYLVRRERILEACALRGGTSATCLADVRIQDRLANAEQAKQLLIQRGCGQRSPDPNPPFCCRTGMANQCSAAASRDECVTNGGQVQEGKTCNAMNNCDPVGGPNQKITWWGSCPESDTCPGTPLTSRDDLIDCVDTSADTIVDELMCLQFPGGSWPCPADVP